MPEFTKTQFDQLINKNSKSMMFIWRNEAGWPIKQCSESAIRKLGLDRQAVKNQSINYEYLVHADDMSRVKETVKVITRANREGVELDDSLTIDYRVSNGQGGWIWVEADLTFQTEDKENTDCIIGLVRDVTDRHKAEQALRRNRDRLELVLEGAQLGMWDWNPQTNEVMCDDRWASMLGLKRSDISMSLEEWSSRVHKDDMAECQANILAHIEGKTSSYENLHRMRHVDGHWVYVLDRGKVVERDSNGKVIRFTGTHTDVTQLKAVELKALAALKSRDSFFSSMSHELRTPLHAVLGVVELLRLEVIDPSQREKISIIHENSEYLLKVLKDILDVSKIEEGQLSLVPSNFDFLDMIEQIRQLFESRALQKGLEFQISNLVGSSVFFETDRTRLMQVVANLVSNAIKYTERGCVTLKIEEVDGDIAFCVHDTGIGIEDIVAIFKPYEQENSRRMDDVHRTGLGLTVTEKLCELMSMSIEVKSMVSVGSCFTLIIPSSLRAKTLQVKKYKYTTVDSEQWPECTVLIVDDNKVNRLVAKSMLKTANIIAAEAEDGLIALELLESQYFDVIFLDLHMPNLGGIRTTHDIRSNKHIKQPYIVGLSADAFPDTIEKCLEAGMNDYLTKPFNRQSILEKVEKYLFGQ